MREGQYLVSITRSYFDTSMHRWYCGVRHGHGVCLYADGTMFEGAWVFGREHGRGVLMTGSRQVGSLNMA